MKASWFWTGLFLAWAAGVTVGSQFRPTLRYPESAAPLAGRRESPVGRLAGALVELGDAMVGLAIKENL